jgi:hypothetical protein
MQPDNWANLHLSLQLVSSTTSSVEFGRHVARSLVWMLLKLVALKVHIHWQNHMLFRPIKNSRFGQLGICVTSQMWPRQEKQGQGKLTYALPVTFRFPLCYICVLPAGGGRGFSGKQKSSDVEQKWGPLVYPDPEKHASRVAKLQKEQTLPVEIRLYTPAMLAVLNSMMFWVKVPVLSEKTYFIWPSSWKEMGKLLLDWTQGNFENAYITHFYELA